MIISLGWVVGSRSKAKLTMAPIQRPGPDVRDEPPGWGPGADLASPWHLKPVLLPPNTKHRLPTGKAGSPAGRARKQGLELWWRSSREKEGRPGFWTCTAKNHRGNANSLPYPYSHACLQVRSRTQPRRGLEGVSSRSCSGSPCLLFQGT